MMVSREFQESRFQLFVFILHAILFNAIFFFLINYIANLRVENGFFLFNDKGKAANNVEVRLLSVFSENLDYSCLKKKTEIKASPATDEGDDNEK